MTPGTVLAGRFRVDGPALGEGQTGTVWPCVDQETGREVAVKVLHDHLVHDAPSRQRLEREAGAASRLSHRHVLRVLGLWADGERLLLVTDRVRGGSAENLGILPPAAALALVGQVAAGLEAAHRAGVVHGDVRPGNVLVGPRGAVLFDFGLGSVRPGQTAPEVAAGGVPTVRSDVYGLGVLLHHAFAGTAPFTGTSAWATVGAQRTGQPALSAPKGVIALERLLLDADPSRRPADASVVKQALQALARDPEQIPSLRPRRIAPLRVGGAWLVHGTDPATGGAALVRSDLTRGRAEELVRRLRAEGWSVEAAREGLDGGDLALAVLAAAVGLWVIPLIGAPLGAVGVAFWLSKRCRPELRETLPPVQTAIPPRQLSGASDWLVVVGVLLLVTAFVLWLNPWAAVPPALLVLVVTLAAATRPVIDPLREAERARVETAFEATHRALATRSGSLEEALVLQGELEALAVEWRSGAGAGDVLARTEDLLHRAGLLPASSDDPTARALDALRRAQAELARRDPVPPR